MTIAITQGTVEEVERLAVAISQDHVFPWLEYFMVQPAGAEHLIAGILSGSIVAVEIIKDGMSCGFAWVEKVGNTGLLHAATARHSVMLDDLREAEKMLIEQGNLKSLMAIVPCHARHVARCLFSLGYRKASEVLPFKYVDSNMQAHDAYQYWRTVEA